MRAETVAEILSEVVADYSRLKISQSFEALVTSLQNLVASPTPEIQAAVNERKLELIASLNASRFKNFPIGLQQYVVEMEISHLLPAALAIEVQDAFSGNDLTPSVALEKIQAINDKSKSLLNQSKIFLESAEFFEITPDLPNDEEFEFSITIPRSSIFNELDNFGRELVKIDKLLGVFSEIATGSRDDFKIKSISSSELNIVLESLPAVAVLIATALERISAVYERILNIINLHKEMKKNDIPENMLKDMEKFIQKTLTSEIAEAAKEIEDGVLRKVEENRRNELRTELKQALKEIASRFDRGYIFDVRGSAPSEADMAEENDAVPDTPPWQRKIVAEKREKLKHFKVEDKPILGLPEPEGETVS